MRLNRKSERFFISLIRCGLFASLLFLSSPALSGNLTLEKGFSTPPQSAGVRCYWWWLNGNVTKEAITRDLEEMHAKGFSGALIFDAGGAEQRGNHPVPAGPMFGSDEWRELFAFAVNEAARLGLELSLNIQSGWNLGGPLVTPEYASKMLTWSEIRISGPTVYESALPEPPKRRDYYKDIVVLAYPIRNTPTQSSAHVRASSSQDGFDVERAFDRNPSTAWVSDTKTPDRGPAEQRPQWLEVEFKDPTTIQGALVQGRTGYGPKVCHLQIFENGNYRTLGTLNPENGKAAQISFDPVTGQRFRLFITDAYDASSPQPRNVQVADFRLLGADDKAVALTAAGKANPIRDLEFKAMFRLLGMAAPDSRHLLEDNVYEGELPEAAAADILDISDKLNAEGVLRWDVPEGEWVVLRFGTTTTGAMVSTSSGRWQGLAIDYMDPAATQFYWNAVVVPLLEDVRPHLGTTFRYLHTDSWECGGANWTPGLRREFLNRRGYDLLPYLPVIAGKLVENRQASNRFLADFRKTLADAMADHYELFSTLSRQHGLGIHPESGGPHAGPFDALQTLGRSDIPMGEFWVPSPHRPRPVDRFYMKQASSAAHIYGRQLAAAEGFTSIGPHWDDMPWKAMKPGFDHELCSGMNLLFIHTFTCSPKEMGLPGQEYFAGTHLNPNITWWDQSQAFMDYMNRCQFLLQQGQFQADVLYYGGDHIPKLIRLKESDPAGALPGFDYDVTNEEALLRYASVKDGWIVYSTGMRYRILVLPDHQVLSHAALRKVEELVRNGATVLGKKPQRAVTLMGYPASDAEFVRLANAVWGTAEEAVGTHGCGKGKVMWGRTARETLIEMGVAPDFEAGSTTAALDYIRRTIDGREVYFVSSQQPQAESVTCTFRVSGKQPQLWDAVTGRIRPAKAFTRRDGRTSIPLEFEPFGSIFVVFDTPIPASQQGTAQSNYPTYTPMVEISGPWTVAFDPEWGGPKGIPFESLVSWTEHPQSDIQRYSGKATYRKTIQVSATDAAGYVLELGRVEDLGIAQVRLNGKDLGIVWTPPFRVDITDALKQGDNRLEIDVVNSWRNRLIADEQLPQEQRLTRTNVRITPQWRPLPSGLLGPVKILKEK